METKIEVSYLILGDSVVVSGNGEYYPIKCGDYRYKEVLSLLAAGDTQKAFEIARTVGAALNDVEKGLEFKDGQVWVNGVRIDDRLAERVISFKNKGLPYLPLALFAEKLSKNPSYNSRQQLYAFLEHNGHPLTEQGNFIAYRSVTSSFKDKHSGKFDNSPGKVCEMPREQVDDNPNNTCSRGLHVACWSYAHGVFSNGSPVVEVEVDPGDVVCVPTDYNGTKMRVCKFKVLAVAKHNGQETPNFGKDLWNEEEYEDEDEECFDCGNVDCTCDEWEWEDEDEDE